MGNPRPQTASPLLAAASRLIGQEAARLVPLASRFQHSFEAPLACITPDPAQPRKHFTADGIAGLAATMAAHGQLQPVLVRRDPADAARWILVAGERRWRAARANGWTALLAIEVDGDAEVMTIIENLQRVDLSPIEEARGLQQLIQGRGWSQDQAAAALGKSKADISAGLRILTLPAALLDAVLTSEPPLSRNALVELARLDEATRDGVLAASPGGAPTIRAIRVAARAARERAASASSRAVPRHSGGRPSAGRLPDPTLLDAATAAIEAAIHDGAVLDDALRDSLERLRQSAESLLRAFVRPPPRR